MHSSDYKMQRTCCINLRRSTRSNKKRAGPKEMNNKERAGEADVSNSMTVWWRCNSIIPKNKGECSFPFAGGSIVKFKFISMGHCLHGRGADAPLLSQLKSVTLEMNGCCPIEEALCIMTTA